MAFVLRLVLVVSLAAAPVLAQPADASGPARAEPVPAIDEPVSATVAPRIVNGVPARQPYPFMVALVRAGVPDSFQAQFCGGSLIRAEWVLTAAHCVEDLGGPGQVEVLIGVLDLSRPATRHDVRRIVIHPAWGAATMENDVALLQLATPSSAPTVGVVVPGQEAAWAPGTGALLLGWGSLTPDPGPPPTWPTVLQEATVPILSDARCAAHLGPEYDPTTMLCAGVVRPGSPGVDACFGDSGGPLLVASGGAWLQVGLVSWGPGCAYAPSAYTRLAAYAGWISSVADSSPAPDFLFPTWRLAGADRYETAAAVSAALGGADVPVFVATGENWPDGILAGAFASAVGGQVLLVRHGSIPPATDAELRRIGPPVLYVMGGTAAISDTVVAELAARTGATVLRFAGADRMETAALAVQELFPPGGHAEVFVAGEDAFPPALLAAAQAAFYGGSSPALLVPAAGAIPAPVGAALRHLSPLGAIWVIGDRQLVADDVAAALGGYAAVSRDDSASPAVLSQAAWAPVAGPVDGVILATSAAFADGLVGASVVGPSGWPLLLVERTCAPAPVVAAVQRLAPAQVLVLGGPAAVADAAAALQPC